MRQITLTLSDEEIETLQNAISFSAWQFEEGGAYEQSNIDFLKQLHDNIKNQTGIKGVY